MLVVHTFNLSTGKAEADRCLSPEQPGLGSEFQTGQGYIVRPVWKKEIGNFGMKEVSDPELPGLGSQKNPRDALQEPCMRGKGYSRVGR